MCGQVLRFPDGVAADVTFWRHKGTTALPRLEPGEQWLVSAAEAEARGDRKGAPPYCRIMSRVGENRLRLLHRKTPAMSRLGTIDWPLLEDPILVALVTD